MIGKRQPVRKIIRDSHLDDLEPSYVLLIDGHSLLKKGLVDPKTTEDGHPYGGVFLFMLHLKQMVSKKNWDYIYCMMDGQYSGNLRHKLYEGYKSNRDKTFFESEYDKKMNEYVRKVISYSKQKKEPKTETAKRYDDKETFLWQKIVINMMLEELFVRQYSFEEVEGDDLIAYCVRNKLPNERIVIMSGDRDLSQLVQKNVSLYDINIKKFVTEENFYETYGIHHSNVVTVKTLVGDSSDAIYGVKGLGTETLVKYFPEICERHVTVEEIREKAAQINEERVKENKKPLKVMENIVNGVTDGSQGDKLYEVNNAIIDLSKPMLTEEAETALNTTLRLPMDSSDRSFGNLYCIVKKYGLTEWIDEKSFGNFFGVFNNIAETEKKREKKVNKEEA